MPNSMRGYFVKYPKWTQQKQIGWRPRRQQAGIERGLRDSDKEEWEPERWLLPISITLVCTFCLILARSLSVEGTEETTHQAIMG